MLINSNKRHTAPSLGQSGEDYLEAVLVLGQERRAVRVKDVARHLGVTRPSVVAALAQLERIGLVRHEHYGDIELTPKGQAHAKTIYHRHQLLFRFLRDILGVDAGVATRDACLLEHAVSAQTTERLMRFVERHGPAKRGPRRPLRRSGRATE